ncbi:MAG: hypothetical protein ACOYMF_15160, partial [Bacteroidales bacterium]
MKNILSCKFVFFLNLLFFGLIETAFADCTVTATASPGTICSGFSSQLNAVITDPGAGTLTYAWSP